MNSVADTEKDQKSEDNEKEPVSRATQWPNVGADSSCSFNY